MMGPGMVPSSRSITIFNAIAWERRSGGTIRKIELVAGTPLTNVKNSVKKYNPRNTS